MGEVLSVFMFGLSFGVVLFLLAAGLTLTMGLMRVINLAHGALYMVGGYVGLSVAGYAHNYWVGVLAGAVCAGLIGLLLEVGFLRRLYGHPTSQVLLTIGFIYIIQNVTMWIWGSYPSAQVTPDIFSGSLPIGSVNIPVFRLVIIVFGLIMALLLWLLQDKTKIGAVVRAGMDNRDIAGALGINLKGVFTGVFVLGAFVAGMIGLVGSTAATGINLGVAWDALLLSMIVVVVGGTGSIQGALVGGITIGLLNAFGAAYFPDFSHFVSYVALILILLIRPGGLLGRQMATGPAAVQYLEGNKVGKAGWWTAARTSAREGLGRAVAPLWRSRVGQDALQAVVGETPKWRVGLHKWLPYAAVVIVLLIVPAFLGPYDQSILTKVIIFALFAASLDLTMGYAGMVSFGHAAFLGVAGYVIGIFTVNLGISSFWVVALIALALTAGVAAIIGYISLRVSGVYYLLVTMGLGQVLSIIALKWDSVTNGMDGLTGIAKPDLGFAFQWTNLKFYYFVFVIFVICYAILRRVVRSSYGRALAGVRLNEQRMRSLGFNTWALKYVGVVVGGVFAAVAGMLYAYNYGNMVPEYVALQTSSLPMLMVIIGGSGTLWGPCLGAAAIILIQDYMSISIAQRWPLLLGCIFVACVMLLRGGFARYLSMAWNRWGPARVRSAAVQAAAGEEGES